MIHKTRHNLFAGLAITLLTLVALVLLGTTSAATTGGQALRNKAHGPATLQPVYTEYRGVRIGMNAKEVRTTLGEPLQKADDMDLYIFSATEAAQIAYDDKLAVKTISVDFLGGVGAPDYKLVVGSDVELKADGAIYKVVRHDSLGVWVYYNRTGGDAPLVTITIQRSLESR